MDQIPAWKAWVTFGAGAILGVALGILASRWAIDGLKSSCQLQYKVYECRVSAVPIKTPTWVK